MKKSIFALSFVVFLAISAIFYFLTGVLSQNKENDLKTFALEKAKTTVYATIPSINRAIENSDDIALLINTQSVAKSENISTSFILDQNSRAIIHNNPSELNTTILGELYEKALSQKAELLQDTDDKDNKLFSIPIAGNNTLFCIFSFQKASQAARNWKIKYFTVAALVDLLITVILYFLAKLFILIPFKRTKRALEKASTENIKNDEYNELTDIFSKEKEKNEEIINLLKENKRSLSEIVEYYAKEYSGNFAALVILDSLNNIVFGSDNSQKILRSDFELGSNILESISNPDILNVISQANDNHNKKFSQSIDSTSIEVLSIATTKNLAGTIIFISK